MGAYEDDKIFLMIMIMTFLFSCRKLYLVYPCLVRLVIGDIELGVWLSTGRQQPVPLPYGNVYRKPGSFDLTKCRDAMQLWGVAQRGGTIECK